METDKALVEVPSLWTGTIGELCGSEGEIINVGSVLVRYGTPETAAVTAEPPPARRKPRAVRTRTRARWSDRSPAS